MSADNCFRWGPFDGTLAPLGQLRGETLLLPELRRSELVKVAQYVWNGREWWFKKTCWVSREVANR